MLVQGIHVMPHSGSEGAGSDVQYWQNILASADLASRQRKGTEEGDIYSIKPLMLYSSVSVVYLNNYACMFWTFNSTRRGAFDKMDR